MTPRERAEKWIALQLGASDKLIRMNGDTLAAEFRSCAADALEAAARRLWDLNMDRAAEEVSRKAAEARRE